MRYINPCFFIIFIAASFSSSAATIDVTQSAEKYFEPCNAAQSFFDESNCLSNAAEKSKKYLSGIEKIARKIMIKNAITIAGEKYDYPVVAFDRAAVAFHNYRDAECERINSSFETGNMGGIAEPRCEIRMNLDRAAIMRAVR